MCSWFVRYGAMLEPFSSVRKSTARSSSFTMIAPSGCGGMTRVDQIALIGPGGAGKSTVAALVADRLGIPCVDLDRRFVERVGDISEYIDRFGYGAYARENVETYRLLLEGETGPRVAALSSGFMTYPNDTHREYPCLRRDLEQSQTTFVLIPSLNRDCCIAETVRRQMERPFARSRRREEAVIRDRFAFYVGLPVRKIETLRPLPVVVDEIVVSIPR
jgi:shikimate kinase